MTKTYLPDAEIDRRGEDLYDTRLRSIVETPTNLGKQIVIDVETEDYEIDDSGLDASRRLLDRHPGASLFGVRIGYSAAYTLGGVLRPTKI